MLAVGFGSSEHIDRLAAYQDENEMPFIFAEGPKEMARQFDVRIRSTKFGIGADGVIRFKHGFGSNSAETWRTLLESLASDS